MRHITDNIKRRKYFRIGIDARMYGPKQTGIGTYIQYLIGNLAKIDKDNQFFLFLLPKTFSEMRNVPNNFHKVKVRSHWYSFSEQIVFLKDILRYKLDLMHFTHFNLPIFYPRKFVVTIHDITPRFFPGHKMGKSWHRRRAYNLIMKYGTKRARAIITPSLKTKKDLVNFYKIEEDKIRVIYEGIKNKNPLDERKEFLANYSQRKEIALKKLKLKFNIKNLEKPFIFYVGVWRDHKNLVNLIRALNILVNKYHFKGQLVLGGREDKHYPEAKREWEKLGLENKIIRPGFLTGEKLTLFYQAADIFVLPSFYEGFGLVTLEALNNGTAVVCSAIEPLKEILQDAALYFNPHDPVDMAQVIWSLLESKQKQKELLSKAQPLLEKYSWERMVKETHKVYLEALSTRK